MNLIIETDLGHDPDDFFAFCYFHSAGVNIRAILVTIGHPFQVEIARFFCDKIGLNIPIGVAAFEQTELKTGGVNFHSKLLNHFNYTNNKPADNLGCKVIEDTLNEYPDCDFFVCGPPKSFGTFLEKHPDQEINHVTVQGGFLSYSLYEPHITLEKFENRVTIPTFNLNGAKRETQTIVDHKGVKALKFVSKNICHTVVYDRNRHEFIKSFPVKNIADELFIKGMDLYLEKHAEKKFHDPTAAVCHLHPEIATWFHGKLYNRNGGWGTRNDTRYCNSHTIADIDYDALWKHFGQRD